LTDKLVHKKGKTTVRKDLNSAKTEYLFEIAKGVTTIRQI